MPRCGRGTSTSTRDATVGAAAPTPAVRAMTSADSHRIRTGLGAPARVGASGRCAHRAPGLGFRHVVASAVPANLGVGTQRGRLAVRAALHVVSPPCGGSNTAHPPLVGKSDKGYMQCKKTQPAGLSTRDGTDLGCAAHPDRAAAHTPTGTRAAARSVRNFRLPIARAVRSCPLPPSVPFRHGEHHDRAAP
jgi:hypothetical protein